MQHCYVELGRARYPIYIGNQLLDQKDLLLQHIHGKQVMIVSNVNVAPLYLKSLQTILSDKQCEVVILPDGEQYKTLDTLNLIFDKLLASGHTRTTTLIALGGGVVGDMTGFAAACYMRGVPFIQVPTTLLAQVDASVGGKTAVNHPLGKNMIGAFYQPHAVLIDINTLKTLPDREFKAGLAEVIKYGLIYDKEFFVWLEQHWSLLLQRSPIELQYAILRSCEIKAAIVAKDEHEQNIRAILNLGHSFGHAIENAVGYGTWLHGEAVGLGLLIAADLSARMQWFESNDVMRIKELLVQADLPVKLPVAPQRLLQLMQIDKKNINQRLRLILLKGLGNAVITEDASIDQIQQILNEYN